MIVFTHLTSLIFGRPTTEMQRYVSVGICQCLQALLVTLREVLCRASVYSMISRKSIPTSSTDIRFTLDREVRIELGRRRAAMTPRWSNAIVFAALFSLCVDVLMSSNEDTLVKCVNIRKLKISKNQPYHESDSYTENNSCGGPLRPKQHSEEISDEIVEYSTVFGLISILG